MVAFQMSVVELKKALKAKGLTTTGKKQVNFYKSFFKNLYLIFVIRYFTLGPN